MVTSFAAGQEKHAVPPGRAQKLAFVMQSMAAAVSCEKTAEMPYAPECAFTPPYPGQFCPSGQKPRMMK
jgi:hypothetical protein